MEVIPFRPELESDVLGLIVGIQRDEFSLDITAEQQPDLHDVPGFYQARGGNFWVAVADGRVVGTISLLDIGNHQGALRKMFVHPDFRGREAGTARRLFETLFDWARTRGIRELFLGTTAKFLAAHRFYEKNGFAEIARSALPPAFPIMTVDTRFFHRHIESTVPRDNEAFRFPVSVKGVVIRAGNVILLKNERDEWELPGGKLEPLESPEACVAREIAEELRLQVQPASLLDSWVYAITPEVRVLIVTYGCPETAEVEAVLSHEHKQLRWFPLAQVPGLPMPEGYKASIRSWARALGLSG